MSIRPTVARDMEESPGVRNNARKKMPMEKGTSERQFSSNVFNIESVGTRKNAQSKNYHQQ